MEKIISIILAGGEGTRLYPLTRFRCKPDVRFGGRYRLIDIPLSNSINSKLEQIFVLTQHFTTSIHQHILATYPPAFFHSHKIELLTPKEVPGRKNLYKGTADAVRQNIGLIQQTSAEYFLILAGDQLYEMNYRPLIEFAQEKDADLTIASLPIGEMDAKRMGLLKIDQNHNIRDFFEKPQDRKTLDSFTLPGLPGQYLGSMGIYVFKRDVLISLLQKEGDDFGKHIIPAQIRSKKNYAFIYDGYWEDIGTIHAYFHANLALTSPHNWMRSYSDINQIHTPNYNIPTPIIHNTQIKESLINAGSIIRAKEISHSVIGMNAHIDDGTIIRDSIIVGDNANPTRIGKNCRIDKAIIDSNAVIGNNVNLVNQPGLHKYDSDGVYVREGIIVVTSGTHLPDGYLL